MKLYESLTKILYYIAYDTKNISSVNFPITIPASLKQGVSKHCAAFSIDTTKQ